jgi:ribosomal protein L19
MYATSDDIKMAKTSNNPAVDRLLNEYSHEIERINMSRSLHEEFF